MFCHRRDEDGPQGLPALQPGPQNDTHGGGLPQPTARCTEKQVLTAGQPWQGRLPRGPRCPLQRPFWTLSPIRCIPAAPSSLRALRLQRLPLLKYFLQLADGVSGGDECGEVWGAVVSLAGAEGDCFRCGGRSGDIGAENRRRQANKAHSISYALYSSSCFGDLVQLCSSPGKSLSLLVLPTPLSF